MGNKINLVFDTKNNMVTNHLVFPTKKELVEYCRSLDSLDNLFVTTTEGFVMKLQHCILDMVD